MRALSSPFIYVLCSWKSKWILKKIIKKEKVRREKELPSAGTTSIGLGSSLTKFLTGVIGRTSPVSALPSITVVGHGNSFHQQSPQQHWLGIGMYKWGPNINFWGRCIISCNLNPRGRDGRRIHQIHSSISWDPSYLSYRNRRFSNSFSCFITHYLDDFIGRKNCRRGWWFNNLKKKWVKMKFI